MTHAERTNDLIHGHKEVAVGRITTGTTYEQIYGPIPAPKSEPLFTPEALQEILGKKEDPAHGFLEEGAKVMKQRAQLRDKPQGERSMEAIVNTFNALTGKNLTEAEGWEFMILLKMVRGRQGHYNRDDYVDGAAYFGLLGECESSRKR